MSLEKCFEALNINTSNGEGSDGIKKGSSMSMFAQNNNDNKEPNQTLHTIVESDDQNEDNLSMFSNNNIFTY